MAPREPGCARDLGGGGAVTHRARRLLAVTLLCAGLVAAKPPPDVDAAVLSGSQRFWDGRGPAPSRNALPGTSSAGPLAPADGPGRDRGGETPTPAPLPVGDLRSGRGGPETPAPDATPGHALIPLDAAGLAGLLAPAPLRARARIVSLFATWCLPCEVELPQLTRVAEASGAELLVVSLDPHGVDARAWLAARGVGAPAYHLPERDAAAAILAVAPDWPQTLPVTFVLPRDGRPLRRFDGVAPVGEIAALAR